MLSKIDNESSLISMISSKKQETTFLWKMWKLHKKRGIRVERTYALKWQHIYWWCVTHQSVCLYVSSQSVDAVAQALVCNVNVAAQLSSVVSLAHVPVMVVPAGAVLGQLEETLVPGWDEELWTRKRSGDSSVSSRKWGWEGDVAWAEFRCSPYWR